MSGGRTTRRQLMPPPHADTKADHARWLPTVNAEEF